MGQLYPLFADLSGRKVVVVGGGAIAEEKVGHLLACGAAVEVVSPEVTGQIGEWAEQGRLEICRRNYEQGDIAGAWLVVVACGVDEVNRQIYGLCREERIFCNIVDVTELCSYQVPAVCRRGPLQIAVSTSGKSPALAKRIRRQLEQQFDAAYERFLEVLSELRGYLKDRYPDDLARRSAILERLVQSEALDLIRQGRDEELERLVEEFKKG